MIWPDNKRFAFTVFDDTDLATLRNVGPVYDFLRDHGLRTTKSCWPVEGDPEKGAYRGETCGIDDYRQWALDLQTSGFEIGWHGSTWHSMQREKTLAALERFREIFGHYPGTATNHTQLTESIYWGSHRLTGMHRLVYGLLTRFGNRNKYCGHIEGDPHFWGDVCRERIKYFRNFVFQDINTLNACPLMPYHDPKRPYVNLWFASSNGNNVRSFNKCLSEANQDRLEQEGGACIMYTHFASGFADGKNLDPTFQKLVGRLAKKDGWFVPVSQLLDYLLKTNGRREITDAQRSRMERKWLFEKLFIGTN